MPIKTLGTLVSSTTFWKGTAATAGLTRAQKSLPPDEKKPWPWKHWSLAGSLLRGCLTGLVLGFLLEVGNLMFGSNVHVVIPGEVYRCAQPSPEKLEELVRTYGIRTVINLRGVCEAESWYLEECRATNRLNVSQEDVGFSAGHLPPVNQVRHLVEVLDRSEYPVLIHCFRGIDRTGLACTIALLLRTDTPYEEARKQLSLRYLHLPWGKTGHLDRFFDLYEEWLKNKGETHSRQTFRHWIERKYCPGACWCKLEMLVPKTMPMVVPLGDPVPMRVRCHNTSLETWRFHPNPNAGIHAYWVLTDAREGLVMEGRVGLFQAEVPPGDYIDLTVVIPALGKRSSYTVQIDLVEEQHCFFHQTGSEPLEWEIEVR